MPETSELYMLLSQRTWDKELNLWVGPERELRALFQGVRIETLDLLDLIGSDVPADDDDIRQYLGRAIRQHLKSIPRQPGQRLVLIVLSAGLLARYGVGVREFYEWFCNDFSMVFLVIGGRCPDMPWPEEVECRSDAMIDYFSETSGIIKRRFGV
jgi:hypothetical protein